MGGRHRKPDPPVEPLWTGGFIYPPLLGPEPEERVNVGEEENASE